MEAQASGEPVDYFQRIRDPKTTAPYHLSPKTCEAIAEGLRAKGFRVLDYSIDLDAYRSYFASARYAELHPGYYAWNLPEKSLEHFVASRLLGIGPGDIYIDVASEHSPTAEIYTRMFGCVSYRQDLAYPEGLNGDRIGGDAAAMPIPQGFATRMALHCSFEHFEGDADIRFARQLTRLLPSGGRVCFAPLYLFTEFAVLTDPRLAVEEQVRFDDDAVVYSRPGWANRHGRLYDPAHLESRIARAIPGLEMIVYRILNAADVDPSCYLSFAAVVTKP